MPGHYVFSTVLFSIFTAVLAGLVAFEAASRTRGSDRPSLWALIGGLALGLGIWSMHFIGMIAWQPPFPLFYTLGRTLLSVLVAIAASWLAMMLIMRTRDGFSARLGGALLVGTGICAMHYIGMSAMRFTTRPMWSWPWVALSFVIAVGASWVAMRLLRTQPAVGRAEFHRQIAGSLIIGIAICGMHYAGMQAMMLAPGTTCLALPGSFSGPVLARLGVGNALLFMLALLVVSYYDKSRLTETAHQALLEAQQARSYAERIEAASKIAASVAHEINNPLEAVTNLLFLIETGELGPREREYLTLAQSELRRVAEITTHTLKFHRQQTAPEPTSLPGLFESALTLFEPRIRSRAIHVERAWPANLPPLLCRAGEIRQVFANLVSNAIDALEHDGGAIRITIDQTPGQIDVRVSDNGRGIPPEIGQSIFQPFFTTKGPAGTGLGLFISAEIVARHGGRLVFTSSTEPGASGTTFHVVLPTGAPAPAAFPLATNAGLAAQPL